MEAKKAKTKTKQQECNGSRAALNQSHMRLRMPSYAAVISWPFTCVTNLLFLYEPQTMNHVVQSGGRSERFCTGSAPVLYVLCWHAGQTPPGSRFLEHSFQKQRGWGHSFQGWPPPVYITEVLGQSRRGELLSTVTAGTRWPALSAPVSHSFHAGEVVTNWKKALNTKQSSSQDEEEDKFMTGNPQT